MAELSYLVMTAADCFAHNEEHRSHGILSLNDMLEQRAAKQPDDVCVAFSRKGSDGTFDADILSMPFSAVSSLAEISSKKLRSGLIRTPQLSLNSSPRFARLPTSYTMTYLRLCRCESPAISPARRSPCSPQAAKNSS